MVTPITVGTTGDYAPFSTTTATGSGDTLTGFDIDLVTLLARASVTFVRLSWSEIESALATARVDLVASGVTVTEPRKRSGLFSRPYLRNHTVVMGRAGAPLPPARLGVNRGGYLETVARARFPQSSVVTVTDNARLPERLLAGEFDAFMSDAVEARKFTVRQPALTVLRQLEAQEHALFFRKEHAALKASFDAALDTLLRDGTVARLAARHGIDAALVPAP